MHNYYQRGPYYPQPGMVGWRKGQNGAKQDGPILIDLDQQSWENYKDRIAQWLGQTLMAQVTFHQLLQDTANKIQIPQIHKAIADIAGHAAHHLRKIEELFAIIGRDPYFFSQYGGYTAAIFKESVAAIKGMLGGAQGDWQMLHQLLLSNLNTLGAFAVTEQFGLLLGLSEITQITMPIVHQKQTDQLVIQEYMLEMASLSIIYQKDI